MALGVAELQEAGYNESASHFAKAVQANPHLSHLYFNQAVALALAGRLEEARPIAQRGLAVPRLANRLNGRVPIGAGNCGQANRRRAYVGVAGIVWWLGWGLWIGLGRRSSAG
jgi:tetratricopeptide (TPR) repeat protein